MSKVAEVLVQLRNEQTRLRRELAQVERVIAALEEAMDSAATANADAETAAGQTAAPYARLTLYEATAAFLAACGEPQTTRQIAEGLRAGGFRTRSENFTNIAGTMLRRARNRGIRATTDGRRWYARSKK